MKLAALGAFSTLLNLTSVQSAEPAFRTDINPALLYFQAFNANHLTEADANYLFDSQAPSPGEPMEERRLNLLKQYDSAFKLLRRARFAKVPCDWGYDLSDGPEAILPGLAPAKRLAQAARFRAAVALEEDRFADCREDFAAALTLARNVSADHILISCLVQIAAENILTSAVMENYYRFSPDQLDELVRAIDSAPRRGTIAETIGGTERDAFFGYVQKKVTNLIQEANGNQDLFWSRFETFWNPLATDHESKAGADPSAAVLKVAAGGTTAGLLELVNEMPSLYQETARVLALPYRQYKEQAPGLFAAISNSPNPIVRQFFTVFKNVRAKEFSVVVRQEMVRAAAAYKRSSKAGLDQVQDPLVGGPFEFSRFVLGGVDRGFRLRSKEQFRDFDEVMIFLEKPGKPFRLDGKNAGQPL